MLYRHHNIISDGISGKRVPKHFQEWHSEMGINDIPGEECTPIILPPPVDLGIIIRESISWAKTKPYKPYRRPKRWLQ